MPRQLSLVILATSALLAGVALGVDSGASHLSAISPGLQTIPVPHYHWAPTALTAEPCYDPNCPLLHKPEERVLASPMETAHLDQTWTQFPAPPNNADRVVHATVYDPDNDKIYMIGGNPAGQSGTYMTSCMRFDPVTNTWQTMAPMPDARGWIQGVYVRGKIYIIAGHTNAGTTSNTNYCYDVATNSWSTLAPMPRSTLAYQIGVWRDSLIYVIGGTTSGAGGGELGVSIYNTYTNTWTSGTNLPEHGDMGSAVIVGDTIYITGALNRSTNSVWTNGRKGAINPANPTSITWSNMPTRPWSNFNGGTAYLQGRVYSIGGFAGSAPIRGCWYYDIATGRIDTIPSLPTPPYRTGLARCHFATGRTSGNELYVVAGDENGDWQPPNSYYYKMQFAVPNDVGVSQILAPDTLISPGFVTPRILIRNYGTMAQSDFLVSCWIDSAGSRVYDQTSIYSRTLAPGATDTLTFGMPWSAVGGTYILKTFTQLDGDQNPANDTMRINIRVSTTGATETWVPTAKGLDFSVRPSIGRGAVHINFSLEHSASINLGIYDAAGNLVQVLENGLKQPGVATYIWNCQNAQGQNVAQGTYFYRLTVNGRIFSDKMVLLP